MLRIRNVSIALLGLVTAIGLGLIAFVSLQGWPGVASGPIPDGPASSGVVQNAPIALAQTGAKPAPPPGQGQRQGGGSNVRVVAANGGTTAHSTLDPSRQVGVAPTAPTHPSAQPPSETPVPPAAAAPPAPQPSAPAPVATPVSTPPSASTGDQSSKPITSGPSKGGTPSSVGADDEKSGDDSDKWWSKSKGDYSSGNSKGSWPKKSKGSSGVEYEDPTSKPAYTPPPPSQPDKGSKDAGETGYSGEYGKSGKDDH